MFMRLLLPAALALATATGAEPVHCFATLTDCLPAEGRTCDLIVEWVEDDGVPRPEAFALAPTWNGAESWGTVARQADGTLTFRLSIEPDPWVGGGIADVSLSPDRSGWSGEAFGQPRQGPAHPRRYPFRPLPVPGFVPQSTTGHPRLLFTADRLADLRAFAVTDQGRDLLHRLEETCKIPVTGGDYMLGYRSAGFALIGLLTGRQDATTRAREMALQTIKAGTAQGETGGYACYFSGLAVSYDLAGEAWPESARGPVRSYLAAWSGLFTTLHVPINQGEVPLMRSGHFQQSPCLHRFRATTLMAALAIRGESTPFTRPEPRPAPVPVDLSSASPPATDLFRNPVPGPVTTWLIAGPRSATLSDPAALRAAPGATIDGQTWQPVVAAAARANPFAPPGPPALRLPGAGRWLLHGAIQTPQPLTGRWRTGAESSRSWIDGTPVADGAVVSMPAGDHAVTVEVVIAPGRPSAIALSLEPVSATTVAEARRAAAGYAMRMQRWEAQRSAYEASGGAWSSEDSIATALRGLARYRVEAHGSTGWPPANNTGDGLSDFLSLATISARNAVGIDLAPRSDDPFYRAIDSAIIRLPNGNSDELYLTGVEPFTAWAAMSEGPQQERFRGVVQQRFPRLGTRLGTFDYNDIIPLMLAIIRHNEIAGPTRPLLDGLPSHQIDPEQASAVFRDHIRDQLSAVRVLAIGAVMPTGQGRREQAHAGTVAMRRGHQNWIPYHRGHDDVYYGRSVLSVPELDGLVPVQGAVLRSSTLGDDGGGRISWDLSPVYGHGYRGRRDVAVAFPGGDVAAVIAIRDRWDGLKGRGWVWRLAQGQVPVVAADGLSAIQERAGWRCTTRIAGPAGATLRWATASPESKYHKDMLTTTLTGDATLTAVIVLHKADRDPGITLSADRAQAGGLAWSAGENGWTP